MACPIKEKFMINSNGLKLFCKHWTNFKKDGRKPRALLFVAHGIAEHCLYYDEIATMLSKEGFYVMAHDHQGHGQSEGPRCLISDMRQFSRDIFMHIDQAKVEFPGLPVFIIGHSMGGCISLLAAIDRPDYFKGVVLISPLVVSKVETVGAARIFFGKIVARVCPTFPVFWLNPSDLSRDTKLCQKYADDPLNYHGGVQAGIALAMINATLEIETKLASIRFPFLVLHGQLDAIVSLEGSTQLHSQAASQDKTLKIFEDCYHQVHKEIEPCKTEVYENIRKWLSARVGDKGSTNGVSHSHRIP